MERVVVDTNVFISALIFHGLPSAFVALAVRSHFKLLSSVVLLDELDTKLRVKFKVSATDADKTRADLEELCEVVSTRETLHVIQADPDDDRVLECAVAGHADYVVTGDHHLLALGGFRAIPILTVRQFMDRHDPAS